jgi:RNA polymerase sigma factor (sigma-70 family)
MASRSDIFFNEVYEEHYKSVLKFIILKVRTLDDAGDIVQDVFAEFYSMILKKGADYVKNPKALLLKICKYRLYRYYGLLYKLRNKISVTDGHNADIELIDYEIDDKYANMLDMDAVYKIVRRKPGDIQKVIYMYYYLDMTIREIASETHLSESDIKHKIYRTLEEIRKLLKEGD